MVKMAATVSLSTSPFLFNYRGAGETAGRCGYDAIEAVAVRGVKRVSDLQYVRSLGLDVTVHLPVASRRSRDLDFSRRYIQRPAYGEIENCRLLDFARDFHVPCVVHASTLKSMGDAQVSHVLDGLWLRIENEAGEGAIEQQLRVFDNLVSRNSSGMNLGLTVDIGHAMIEKHVAASGICDFADWLIRQYDGYPVEEVHASRVFGGGSNKLVDHGLWPSGSEHFLGQVARFVGQVNAQTVVFEFYPNHLTAVQLNFGRQLEWFESRANYAAKIMKAALARD